MARIWVKSCSSDVTVQQALQRTVQQEKRLFGPLDQTARVQHFVSRRLFRDAVAVLPSSYSEWSRSFVLSAFTVLLCSVSGTMCLWALPCKRSSAFTPGALAPERVMLASLGRCNRNAAVDVLPVSPNSSCWFPRVSSGIRRTNRTDYCRKGRERRSGSSNYSIGRYAGKAMRISICLGARST